jgi:mannose-6-phosphate isomerase-like protein (cupin superfamily)
MRHIATGKFRSLFKVLHSTATAQAAMMTLRPGQSSSDEVVNEHPRCEQWLYVISGAGKATVGKRSLAIRANSLLVIEQGEAHKITNTGHKPLVTFNVYVPPAYTAQGDLKALARIPTLKALRRMA